jgi:hypothetical protein
MSFHTTHTSFKLSSHPCALPKKILASFKETFIPTSMITIELNWGLQHIFFVVFAEYKKNEFMYIHDTSKITFFLHFLGTFAKL